MFRYIDEFLLILDKDCALIVTYVEDMFRERLHMKVTSEVPLTA